MKGKNLKILDRVFLFGTLLLISISVVACGPKSTTSPDSNGEISLQDTEGESTTSTDEAATSDTSGESADNLTEDTENQLPLQMIEDNYRTYYEVFVNSFYDSNDDGVGDFDGLTQKLDYINDGDNNTDTDLGFNGIWLMPIMPSPTYHKYDVTDYYGIDSSYGTMDDFKEFMAECNSRGIKVIIDMVINHTSSEHPWFVEATDYLKNLGDGEPDPNECPYINYYNFSREKSTICNTQVPGTDWYYEARFWSGMPDLNLANEDLRLEFKKIAEYWMDLGVGGFRMDAAKEFYSGNITANVEVLTWFNTMVKEYNPDAYIVAEVWSDVDEYAKYYESGIDSLFDFEFADNGGIIANVVKGTSTNTNASTYGKSVAALSDKFSAFNEDYIDAPFYTNHDLARSAGYYSGENRVSQTKIAGALNLFMSGSAFVYYGEEIGMKGSGKDENKRAAMQWFSDATAQGMCDGPDNIDAIKMINGSLEEQETDPLSIYNYYKEAVKIRNQNPEIARGEVTFEETLSSETICVLRKTYNEKEILLVFNISAEAATIDLSSLSLNGIELTDESIRIQGELEVEASEATLEQGVLTLPQYGVTVIW
jgi:glycosidase